jgi:hypothetical protein
VPTFGHLRKSLHIAQELVAFAFKARMHELWDDGWVSVLIDQESRPSQRAAVWFVIGERKEPTVRTAVDF